MRGNHMKQSEGMSGGEALILSTSDLTHPEGKRFWLDDDMFPLDAEGMHVPRFSVQEVAKSFFGQSADWLRWRMRSSRPRNDEAPSHPDGYFILDGEPMEFKRLKVNPKSKKADDPNASTARYYTLADIERMAHALGQQGVFSGQDVAHIVLMVQCCSRLWGLDTRSSIAQPEPEEIE